ncbi:MAG TPA: IS630 family transposase [Phycisphaerales bacterium]|nr:IS630 family transposase [Phycisphaerales bacterium]HMP36003.1 IS630 family transposase [Phycisphaerales bacterium]
MPKQDARKLAPAAQEDLRRRVMAAVDGGMGVTEAARTFGVARQSIHNWRKAVEQGGASALRARKRGPKAGVRSLAPHQRASIVRSITAGCPDQLRLPFALWTRDAVIELAQRRFGVVVSRSTMGRYLREWGMSPQKPVRRAFERDPASVRRWLESEYPAIVAKARRAKAEIHWADEMGLRSDHQAGTTWSRRGVTPVVPGTGRRFGCNMISAVTNRGSLAFMVFTERFTAAVMLRFLRRLIRQAGRKVFLVVDGHPVHRSSQVRRWVADNARSIEMFHLPPYSPDLNPDEFLNNDVKSNAVGRRRPADRREMIAGVRAYLRSTQRRPDVVRRYFHAESVRYAA